jgi:site-specific DNA recombinase
MLTHQLRPRVRRLFEAFRLTIHYDKRTNSARCRVIICADNLDATAATAETAMSPTVRDGGASFPMCAVPPAGFEPATPALGERCSIP